MTSCSARSTWKSPVFLLRFLNSRRMKLVEYYSQKSNSCWNVVLWEQPTKFSRILEPNKYLSVLISAYLLFLREISTSTWSGGTSGCSPVRLNECPFQGPVGGFLCCMDIFVCLVGSFSCLPVNLFKLGLNVHLDLKRNRFNLWSEVK